MKILQIIYQLGNGGAEKICVELSNELVQRNEVVLCSATKIEPGMIHPRKLSGDVRLIQLNLKKKSLKGFYQIFKIIKDEKPDIVHIHSSLLFFYFSILMIVFRRIEFVHTVHNTITPAYKKLFDLLYKVRFLYKNLHHVCISSNNLKKYQEKYSNLHFYKIDNGIAFMTTTSQLPEVQKEIEKIRKGRNYLFIAIGNYSIFKNFPMLIEVIKKLNLEGFEISLIILGEDKSEDQVQWKLVEKNKDDHTHQLGLKENVADFLFCSDALIMSSTKEGMPLVALEAMAMGIPVISTPTGGVVDMIRPGVNGFLARGFELEDLEREILSFIKYKPSIKQKLQIESKRIFPSKYSMNKCAKDYFSLYQTILND
jgi:glycosyltransferase involved in cell wall biosynthesis